MAQNRTAGFDMLVQISENELNTQLAAAFLAGDILPASMSVPFSQGGAAGAFDLNFGAPILDLDRPSPRIGITLPFLNSQLLVTAPLPLTIAPLGGTITIVDRIEMIDEGGTQTAALDFDSSAPTVTVEFDAASAALLNPLLAAAGLTLEQVQNQAAAAALDELRNNVGRLELTPPIPVTDDADATTVFDIDVTTVNDTTAADRDCLAFGLRMASDGGGNINSITSSLIPPGGQSLVMMSNFWLLGRVMRRRIATELGRPITDFDTPLRLNRSIPAPGGQGMLDELEARVVGNRIEVTGRASDSGTGWSATSDFQFFIDIGMSGGEITITASTPSVDTDVDLAWWVVLVSLGLGGLFFGIVGVIVAAVVLAIVHAVAEGIADGLVSDGLSGAIGNIPSIPLGPIGSGITLDNVVLDDLELISWIRRADAVPVHRSGTTTLEPGMTLDLDSGVTSNSIDTGTDLVWQAFTGLSTDMGAGLTVIGSTFGSVTPVEVSRLPLGTTQLTPAMVPTGTAPTEEFIEPPGVVFGVRTSEGRLAKVRAYRDKHGSGDLRLTWKVWATPTPALSIKPKWFTAERGEVTEHITADCQFCRSFPVRRCATFDAWPRLMAFPVDYQWCLCGEVLTEGRGEVSANGGVIEYHLQGRRLQIQTAMGDDLDCELCVSAIDRNGMELFTCIPLKKSGVEEECRSCTPHGKLVHYEYLPVRAMASSTNWQVLDLSHSM